MAQDTIIYLIRPADELTTMGRTLVAVRSQVLTPNVSRFTQSIPLHGDTNKQLVHRGYGYLILNPGAADKTASLLDRPVREDAGSVADAYDMTER